MHQASPQLNQYMHRLCYLGLGILCYLQSSLSCADYQDLGPQLHSEERQAWESAYASTAQPILADLIWFCYANGYGTSIDYKQARTWHQKALAENQPLAQLFQVLSLRNRHWINEYAEPDPQTINRTMHNMLNDAHRQFNQLPDGPAARCWQGLAELELGKIDDGLKLLQFAAESGYRDADAWLGYAYCYRKRDHKKAVVHLELAHSAGIAWSSTEYAHCHMRGWGLPRDRNRGIALYLAAAQQQERKALLSYSQHNARDSDSFKYAQEAAAIGDPDARHHLAFRYEHGHGCDIQIDAAIQIHTALYQQFHGSKRWTHYGLRACYELGRLYDKLASLSLATPQKAEQIQYYQRAHIWYQKFLDTLSNPKDARIAQVHLALAKHAALGLGREIDLQAAFRHYTIAADKNNGEAQMRLADCYFHGHGTNKDSAAAKMWYEKSLKTIPRRDPILHQAQAHYLSCLESLDIHAAIAQYKNFSQQGNAQASYRLLCIYRELKKSPDEIQALLEQAAAQGNPQAQQELEQRLLQQDADLLNDF